MPPFLLADDAIQLPDASVDGAVGLNVFAGIRTLSQMRQICRENAVPWWRLHRGVIEPMAFGRTFRSYWPPSDGRATGCSGPDSDFWLDESNHSCA